MQGLDFPFLFDQTDGVVVVVSGRLVGAIDSDTCKHMVGRNKIYINKTKNTIHTNSKSSVERRTLQQKRLFET